MICLIAIALTHLLADYCRKAIYFDGALPVGKQATRLDRLEKSRALLEKYRKQHPEPFEPPKSKKPHASAWSSEYSVWKKRFAVPGRRHQLPPPPFMVACVLDGLRNTYMSRYAVKVVPGEADSYCATVARNTDAAILSNDSDMTMYDLGSEGSLVLLDSLDLVADNSPGLDYKRQTHTLKGQRLHPVNIARRLNLNKPLGNSSLLRYGFERASDSSATAGMIRSRCISSHSAGAGEAFQQFCELYKDPKEIETTEDAANPIVQLDPRLAELYCQYNCAEYMAKPPQGPHIYMPIVIEDPTRDSSWTYGRGLRILGYSLLKHSAENAGNLLHHESVMEFGRRGPRVVGTPLKLLDKAKLTCATETMVRDLRQNASRVDSSLQWRLFAFKEVNQEKARNGKPTIPHAWVTEFLSRSYVGGELSWDDIHLNANMQAVLYSLWILRQACVVSKPHKDLQIPIDHLSQTLQPLLPLERLMASRWEILEASLNAPTAEFSKALGLAYLQGIGQEQKGMANNVGPGSNDGAGLVTSKVTLTAKIQRRRANGNIFELLDPS